MAVSTLASFAFSNRLSARNVCGSKDVFTRHTLNSGLSHALQKFCVSRRGRVLTESEQSERPED